VTLCAAVLTQVCWF